MKHLLLVITMELRLHLRGKTGWLLATFMAVSSLYVLFQASLSHSYPRNFWPNMALVYLLLTFVLVFATGDQIQRDRDCRLDDIILSTPIATATYVSGKYLASWLVIVGLALVNLLITLVGDALLPAAGGAIIGPGPYVASWCVLVLVPLLFGAAVTLLTTTATRGQWVVTGLVICFVWLGPFIITVLTGKSYALVDMLNVTGWFPLSLDTPRLAGSDLSAPEVVRLVQLHVPWDHLTSTLWLNRAIFVLLAMLCFLGTIASLDHQRSGSACHVFQQRDGGKKGPHR
jgi:ABC-type transport system involved in multi-copper enzyme maturation permease subunit